MKYRNISSESLIVNGGIVHAGAEVECERDPRIDGLVPVEAKTGTRVPVQEEPVRKVGAERVAEKPEEEETEDDFGGGA